MKKKLKLLTTIASVSLALGMMVFGILAATNVTVGVSSTVTYTAEGIAFKLYGTVELLSAKPTGTATSVSGSEANLLANVNIQSTGTETATLDDKEFTADERWVVMTFTVKNVGSNVIGTINVVPTAADTNVEATTDSESITANLSYNQETTFRVYYYLKNVNMSIFNGTTNTAITMLQEGIIPSTTDQSFIAPNSLDGFEAVVNGTTTTYTKGDEKFEVTTSTSGSTVNETNKYTNGEKVTTFTTTYDTSTVQASAQNTPAMTFGAQALSAEYVVADRTLVSVNVTAGDASKVVIPEWLNIDAIVNSVNACFYKLNNLLQEVVLPSTLTSIGDYAFSWCQSLLSITIPEGVTSIGNNAFYGCSILTEIYNLSSLSITAGSTDNGYVAKYAKVVHTSADEPTRIVKNNGVVYYVYGGEKIALRCLVKNATSITLDSDTTEIESNAFNGCSFLTSIDIPEGVTSIGAAAFYGCSSLTSIDIPEGVTSIENSVFKDCSSLTSINIPEGVTSIGDSVFENCRFLTSINIPEGVTSIGESVFYCCISLNSITIPEGVTSIESSVFNSCNSLTSITIPAGVTSIGRSAFNSCFALAEVYNFSSLSITAGATDNGYLAQYAKVVHTSADEPTRIVKTADMAYYVYNGEKIALTPLNRAGVTSIVLDSDTTSINGYAFISCNSLTSIIIPQGVTSIGKSAFYGCTSLTSITIPSSVTSVGRLAFSQCYALAEVYNLSSLNITAGATDNGLVALYAKVVHTSASEPTRIVKTADMAYYVYNGEKIALAPLNKARVTSIVLDSDTTSVNKFAFDSCISLTSIEIPKGVISIGEWAFSKCKFLTSINISEGVTSIGKSAFYGCSSLTSITIPESVTSIGAAAFDVTGTKLATVTIDSATVASGLTSQTAMGEIIEFATTVKIKSGLTVGSYVTNKTNFPNVTTEVIDGVTYNVYSK